MTTAEWGTLLGLMGLRELIPLVVKSQLEKRAAKAQKEAKADEAAIQAEATVKVKELDHDAGEISRLREENRKLWEDLRNEHERSVRQEDLLRDDIRTLKDEISALHGQMRAMRQEIDGCAETRGQLISAQGRIRDLETTVETKDAEIRNLKVEVQNALEAQRMAEGAMKVAVRAKDEAEEQLRIVTAQVVGRRRATDAPVENGAADMQENP